MNKITEKIEDQTDHYGIGLCSISMAIINHYVEDVIVPEMQIFIADEFSTKPEPGVRAFVAMCDRELALSHHFFSHEESIATATLISHGVPRHVAAAAVHQGFAFAISLKDEDSSDDPLPPTLIDIVQLEDRSYWEVFMDFSSIHEGTAQLHNVGDYTVVGSRNGEMVSFDEADATEDSLVRANPRKLFSGSAATEVQQ